MLVLSRKTGESIVVNGGIRLTVLHVDGGVVKVGIEAPPQVAVHRQEVYDEIQRTNHAAVIRGHQAVPRLRRP
jgi:carbon storage regulator